jgi:ABC-type nitrate/sulfonate/bicarbonate transport system permease component
VALLLASWQGSVSGGVISSDAVAAPSAIVLALNDLWSTSAFWDSVGNTLHTWSIGFGISFAMAVPIGLALGASNLAYRMSRVSVDFLRTIPPVALLPLVLLLDGATEKMALTLVVFGSIWPLLLQTMYGVHQIDPMSIQVARSYHLRRQDVALRLYLPSAAPLIATGARIAATTGLLLAVGAELLGGAPGLGASITHAQQNLDVADLYAYVVTTAVLGIALNAVLVGIERRVLPWHPANRAKVSA